MDYTAIFERVELKYVLTASQQKQLMMLIADRIQPDEYPHSEINSIYFDSPTCQLIRSSLDHPAYKEKVRMRSYTTVKNDSDPVFLELKKKYLGVTYKRRQEMTYREAMNYIQFGTLPCSSQIMKEIDHVCRKQYELSPKVLISYSRDSFAARDHDVRITFDHDIRFSLGNLSMKNENRENRLTDDEVIMEVKTITSMPMWLVTALDSLHIYPSNFSKYGQIYQQYLMKGVQTCHSYYSIPYSRPHLKAPLSSFAPQHP